jgi:hypothetical protein
MKNRPGGWEMDLNTSAADSVRVTVTLRIYIPCSNLSRVINIPKVFLNFHRSFQANPERIF